MEKPESETGKSDSGSQRKTGTGQYAGYDESIRAEPDSGTRYASPYDYSERICIEKRVWSDRNLSGLVTGKLCRSSGGKMDKNPESGYSVKWKEKGG